MKKNEPTFYAAVVPINTMGQVLLGKRKEDGKWTTPAGGSEEGETPEKTAIRELFEEAGIPASPQFLQPLAPVALKNGKFCHCFLYVVTPGTMATSKLDPDDEVGKWKWFFMDELPNALREDENRFTSVRNAFARFHGITKSLIETLEKGGPGSGVRGHVTPHLDNDKVVHLNHKLEQLSPYEQEHHKLSQGAVWEGKTLRSGKPVLLSTEAATAHGYTPQDFREVANIHYDHAERMSQVIEKIKVAGKEPSQSMKNIVKFHTRQFKANSSAADTMERRSVKTDQAIKDKAAATRKVAKSVVAMSHQDAAEVDTSKFSMENSKSQESEWFERFHQSMDGYQFGDNPREIHLDRGCLHLVRVDDGIYSGVFKSSTPVADGVLEDTAKVRIERMSIPSLVQFCMAKEWILPPMYKQPEQSPVMVDQTVKVESNPIYPVESEMDRKYKMLVLIGKLVGVDV